ncbi:MAG: putative toxin-antitoxin system toxin component, PIN family [Cyanobacterium sp. T60_A2020_053]|nr:putative toxin-antitoxin system toxin component, PIN family [Cyanobacterium sp. T60_A2020_053]
MKNNIEKTKISKKNRKNGHSIEYLLNFVEDICSYCSSNFLEVEELRDSKDTIILSAGVSAPAQVIITGDLDLLVLVNFNHISILNPQDFLTKYFPKVIN